MEEYLTAAVVLAILLGYVGLAAAVGLYASNRGWSFFIFFLLALFFNPPLVFVGFIILDGVWSAATDESLAEEVRSLGQSDAEVTKKARDDTSSDATSASMSPDESSSPRSTRSADASVTPDDLPLTKESSSSDDRVSEADSLDASYEEDTGGREEDGKVRCDTCYSFVDESASECPACGADLGSESVF